jgi:hypothetical protein
MRKAHIFGTLLLFLLVTIGPAFQAAQDFSRYEALKEPRLTTLTQQKMLVVEAKGDPNVKGQEAFSLLFRTFFRLPGVKMSVPKARWLDMATAPKEEWTGLYALALPENITQLPPDVTGVRIETWEYGEVAEILHVGPYSEETPTIEKLLKFITTSGYVITGPHEEEYLRGPGMAKDPKEYMTIIRYQVKKK